MLPAGHLKNQCSAAKLAIADDILEQTMPNLVTFFPLQLPPAGDNTNGVAVPLGALTSPSTLFDCFRNFNCGTYASQLIFYDDVRHLDFNIMTPSEVFELASVGNRPLFYRCMQRLHHGDAIEQIIRHLWDFLDSDGDVFLQNLVGDYVDDLDGEEPIMPVVMSRIDTLSNEEVCGLARNIREGRSMDNPFHQGIAATVNQVLTVLARQLYDCVTGRYDLLTSRAYMSLLTYALLRDRSAAGAQRSFSFFVPFVEEPNRQAKDAFRRVRCEIDHYREVMSAELANQDPSSLNEAYERLDRAREEALREVFDTGQPVNLMAGTFLNVSFEDSVIGTFLPDPGFRHSFFAYQGFLDSEFARGTFRLLVDALSAAIRSVESHPSPETRVTASLLCQPALDFGVWCQAKRLHVEHPDATLGTLYGSIVKKLKKSESQLGAIVYLAPKKERGWGGVFQRRNHLAHPSAYPQEVERSRGQVLADICRVVDFLRYLDYTCEMWHVR